jgi:hypothetical protein
MAWPYLGPFPPEGPMREVNREIDPVGGHPTAPGALDKDDRYPRLPVTMTPGNGVPGRPRYKRLADRHGKMGGMLPGNTPNGPQQPGVEYDDGSAGG